MVYNVLEKEEREVNLLASGRRHRIICHRGPAIDISRLALLLVYHVYVCVYVCMRIKAVGNEGSVRSLTLSRFP